LNETELYPLPIGSDSSYNESNYPAYLETILNGLSAAFPTTTAVLTYNYLGATDGSYSLNQGVSLMAAMKANYNNVGEGGPDVFGSGTTDGQSVYNGSYGGTDYRGIIPCLATMQDSEFVVGYGIGPWLVAQIISNANSLLKPTHFASQCHISGLTGVSGTFNGVNYNGAYSALWYGSASSIAQWNSAPGTFSGVLDAMYNNPLVNATYPTNFP